MCNTYLRMLVVTGIIFCMFQYVSAYSGGDGSPENPYRIADANDLLELAADTNDYIDCFILINNINMANYTFDYAVIARDTSWKLGFQGTAFCGVFDGDGYVISNLTVRNNDGDNSRDYLGLFGCAGPNSILMNIGLENIHVEGNKYDYYTGGLVGWIDRGNITNCHCSGTVRGGNFSSRWTGGLAAISTNSIINQCYSTGTVYGIHGVGGLVASNEGGSILNCYSTANVDSYEITGGLVGQNKAGGIISHCYSSGYVDGDSDAGGLVALNDANSSISYCCNTGTTHGDMSYAGGLVGQNRGCISACYSTGGVGAQHTSGGLVGKNTGGSISNCYSTATIGGNEPILGGLVAYNSDGGSISNCYAAGPVHSYFDNEMNGGLVGNLLGTIAITGNFWDVNSTQATKGVGNIDPDPAGVTGKTTAEMKTLTTFISEGWDFTNETDNGTNNYWRMCSDGVHYPGLNWELPLGDFACPDGVYLEDLIYIIERWLLTDCNLSDNYCSGADIDVSGIVDNIDFALFADNWQKYLAEPAYNPYPANGSKNVDLNIYLSWAPGLYALGHDVYLGTSFNEVNDADILSPQFKGNQTTNIYHLYGLDVNTTYYWRIDETGPVSKIKGDIWSFTTIPPPPGAASNPIPIDGATDVSRTQDLSWTAGSGATSHDVYFGTTNPPPYKDYRTSTTYDTGTMDLNTTYYWRITERNVSGITTGTVWSFTTVPPLPPGAATNPVPADGATDVSRTQDLGWTAGSGATSHDVYFGTTNPPPFIQNQTGTAVDTGTLDYDTTYYWRIDEKNATGTTAGVVWSFTTFTPPPPGAATNPFPSDGAINVYLNADLYWTAGSDATSHDVYFGTTNPPPFKGNQTSTIYDTGTMDANTTYYWRIDEKNTTGTTTGVLWNFTTGSSGVIDPNLVGWWKFDETGGMTAEDSAGENDGTLIKGPVWTSGLIDGALQFDGINDCVNAGHSSYLKPDLPVTICGWIYRDVQGHSHAIIATDNSTGYYYGIWFYVQANNKLQVSYGDGGIKNSGHRRTKIGSTELLADTWYHVAAVIEGPTDIKIYVNGVDDGGACTGSGGPLAYSAEGDCLIGVSDLMNYCKGRLDDVRIYNRALSAGEVQALYEAASPDPIAHWKFDETSGTIAHDSAGNYNGVVSGAIWIEGMVDGCLDFDGNSDYVDFGDIDELEFGDNDFTVAFWFYTEGPHNAGGDQGSYGIIVGKYNWGLGRQWSFQQMPSGQIKFATYYTHTDGEGLDSQNGYEGQWVHCAGVREGLNKYLYINGVLDVNGPCHGVLTDRSSKVLVGAIQDPEKYYQFFNGKIDDVRIYDRALTAAEIQQLCDDGQTTPPGAATNPSPANGATDISLTSDLSWTAGSDATSHDVYFGTTNPPPFKGNQTSTIYDTGTMDANITYYWRIDEKNAGGTTTGVLWNFTTGSGGMIDPNLVGWWKFDESSGTIAYDSAGNNNGTVTGAIWTDGQINGALDFDGMDDYVVVPDNDNSLDMTSQITISAWIKPDDISNFYCILAKQPSGTALSNYPGNYEFRIIQDTGILQLLHQTGIGTSYTNYRSTIAVTAGVWQHVAVTILEGDSVYFYINGQPAGTLPQTTVFGILNDEPVRIGTRKDGIYDFNGDMDDVRIYNRALSAGEVQALYEAASPDPIAHWKFDETSGTTAEDGMGDNNGTLINGPVWTAGQIDGALEFDGYDDYVDIPYPHDLKIPLPITLSAWVKQYDRSNNQFIIITDDDFPRSYVGVSFGIALNGTLGGGYHDGGPPAAYSRRSYHGSIPLDLNTWYHVVYVVRGPIDMEFYINAEEDTSSTYSGSGGDLTYTPDGSAYIGTGGDPENLTGPDGARFDGIIDDVRIYDGALTEAQILQLYNEGLGL